MASPHDESSRIKIAREEACVRNVRAVIKRINRFIDDPSKRKISILPGEKYFILYAPFA